MSNFYPAIPDPQNNTESLSETTRALKMAVETLSGQREGGAATRVFEQTDEPKDPRVGDTWVEKKDAGRIRLWNGSFWVDVSDSRFSVLEKSTADASAMIKELSQVRVTDTEAFAQKITELKAEFQGNVARIYDEMTVRATATEALAQRITSLSATFNAANYATANALTASVTTEQTARANADGALARQITSLSAGTSRVYVTATAPLANDPTYGVRQNGDVWYDADNNYLQYVWYNSAWNDNSSGAYSKYTGQYATIWQTMSASTTVGGVTSYKYALLGTTGSQTINGQNYSGIILSGGQQIDPTTGLPGAATSTLVLRAGSIILDGNVIVNGTITVGNDGKSPIAANAVSESIFGTGNGAAGVPVTANAAGDKYIAIASYVGGDQSTSTTISGSNNIESNMEFWTGTALDPYQYNFASAPIRTYMTDARLSFNSSGLVTGIVNDKVVTPVTYVAAVTAAGAGTIKISVTTGLTKTTNILVIRLSR